MYRSEIYSVRLAYHCGQTLKISLSFVYETRRYCDFNFCLVLSSPLSSPTDGSFSSCAKPIYMKFGYDI